MDSKSQNQSRNYVLIYPVYNLEISQDIGGEIQIERVVFVARDKIPRIRRRLGFAKKISEENKVWEKHHLPKLFSEALSCAFIIFRSRNINEDISEPINKIKEAFWLLASSQFFLRRDFTEYFGSLEYQGNITTGFTLYDRSQKFAIRHFKKINPLPYKLDKNWKMYKKNHFFSFLLRILNGKIAVNINSVWKKTIRSASILAGKSVFSKEISQAFIYNMIAIDSLLQIDPSEKYPNSIINRYNALFGWLTKEDPRPWKEIINRLYKLRCQFVHDGDISDIKTGDIINSDCILFNLLYNICRFIKLFPNKKSLTDLSDKIKAKKFLGQKITGRPIFIYFHPDLSQITINRIRKENNWP
jgi:hypothetical protein